MSRAIVKVMPDTGDYSIDSTRIERMFGYLKTNRAITIRYDQLASSFSSMIRLAIARYWLKFVHAV